MYVVALKLFFSGLFSFLFTYYLIPIFIVIAEKYNIVDIPDGNIKVHRNPTPYLGGAAIYLGFLCTLALTFPFDNQFFHFLVGSTLLFYVGLIDDLIALSPLQKLIGQIIAVLCFLKAGFYLKAHIFYNFWNLFISAFWMLLVINAFNLIDIMDGLAITVAIFSCFNFLLLALLMEHYVVAFLLASMLGAFIAFFCFNKPSAVIYLGDAGSLLIGGLFSSIPFLFSWGCIGNYGYIIPLIILAIPLLEVCGLICIRTYKNIPFYKASKDHFALYLKRSGFSEKQILYFVGFSSLFLTGSTLLMASCLIEFYTIIFLGLAFLIYWIYTIFFFKKRVF